MTEKFSYPGDKGIYYGGAWHRPKLGGTMPVISPGTGEVLTRISEATPEDVPALMAAAKAGFDEWRHVVPAERSKILREMARRVRAHGSELAWLDSSDCGNPIKFLSYDIESAAASLEFFAGLVTEMKGASMPIGPDGVCFSVREPYGVVVRIAPFNHPALFCIAKAASPIAAGNSVIVKSPEQAPMSSLLVADIFDGLLPPGVFNVVSGGRELGAALVSDPGVAMVGLVGSVPTGRAIMRAASDRLTRVIFELGGKNALIALPDADPAKVADAMVRGMNFGWAGQSCGSTSRAFVHASMYDEVLSRLPDLLVNARPGIPTDPDTVMGALIDRSALERVQRYVAYGLEDGARLIHGGKQPEQPELRNGCFFEPTIFADVTQDMRIAREEIFGPVLSIIKWDDEAEMLRQVNSVEYGLTCSVWTRDVAKAHRMVAAVEAGYCWINDVSRHAWGAPFGGYKQSGIGREECLEELLSYTQEKNVLINLNN